jgi:predicted GIY-YIG superfamily endonuclease
MRVQYALYRYFDEADRLLYAGRTIDMARRTSSHIARSDWMQFAARSTIRKYPSHRELCDAERKAIETEHPIFNRQFNDTPEAAERLRGYLEEVGRPDLIPAHLREDRNGERPSMRALLAGMAGSDVLDVVWKVLTIDNPDHACVRLWALAALEGRDDLPRGGDLERLAALGRMKKATAYRAIKVERLGRRD